jgi:hypothetical protein
LRVFTKGLHRHPLILFWLCLVTVLATGPLTRSTAAAARPASEVKAAYLFKFSSYVQWPQSAFGEPNRPATLCVVGEDPFGRVLDETMEGREINSRPIKIRRIDEVNQPSDCLVLYIGNIPPQQASKALAAVNGSGVLTVTDAASIDDATGIINFVMQDNSIRFSINEEAAVRNGLVISSKLLSLSVPKNGD